MSDRKAVLLFSGGLDSTSLIGHVQRIGFVPYLLSVDYGQRHKKELKAASAIAEHLGLLHRVVRLNHLRALLSGSALTDDIEVPEGHYEAESMKQTVVPNRNMIMIAIAGGWAESLGADSVWTAVHSGDHAIYPDCRPDFISAARRALILGTMTEVTLGAPFVHITKGEIVRVGMDTNMPLEMTWSCYKGEELHCGVCGTCVERKEAFAQADLPDPTWYNE